MKLQTQGTERPVELSALTAVVALLMAGVLAKFGVATQLFHLVH